MNERADLVPFLFDDAFRPLDLQASQVFVLVVIALVAEDGAPLTTVADRLVMDRTTLTRNIRPLERAGLVRIARSPTDARTRLLFLTKAGERKVEAVPAYWREAQAALQDQFGARTMKLLIGQLGDIVRTATQSKLDSRI